MNVRRLLSRLTLLLSAAVVVSVAVSVGLAYRAALLEVESELQVAAASWARLIIAAAAMEEAEGQRSGLGELLENLPQSLELNQAQPHPTEVVVGLLEGDSIRLILASTGPDAELPPLLPLDGEWGTPVQEGLRGRRGLMRGRDHRGLVVVAGVEPLPGREAAVVVQHDLAELRAPFLQAGAVSLGLAALILTAGLVVGRHTSEHITREVTDLGEARRRLDRRIRLAVEGGGMGFWEVDLKEGRWKPSEQLRRELGCEDEGLEQTVTAWTALMHPDDRRLVRDELAALRNREITRLELRYRIRSGNGSWRWIQSQGILEEGAPDRAVGVEWDVTDQERAREKVQQQEQRLSAILQALPSSSVSIVDEDLRYVFRSGQEADGPHLDPEARPGHPVAGSMAPEAARTVRTHLAAALKGAAVDFEVQREDRALLIRAAPLDGGGAGPIHVLCLIIDITDQTEREALLYRQGQRLNQIISNIPGGVVTVVDRELRIVFAAGEPLNQSGISAEARIGTSVMDWVSEAEREMVQSNIETVFRGETLRYNTYHVGDFRGSDEEVGLAFTLGPLRDPDGDIQEVLLLSIDVTEDLRAREELQAAQDRLEMALEAGGHATFDYHVPSDIIEVGDSYAELLGLEADELRESLDLWRERIHPEDRGAAKAAALAHMEGMTPDYEQEYRIRHASGSWIWVRSAARTVAWDEEGRPLRVLGTVTDITEKRILEEQIRQSQKMEALGQLTGGLAHDFNNILTGILTNVGLARRDVPAENQEAHEDLAEIERAAERGANLIRKLMAFSRDDYLELVPVSLSQALESMESFLTRTLPDRIILHVESDGSGVAADLDMVAMQQIILNLANNARDAMPEGGRLTLRSRAGSTGQKAWAIMEIEDTGAGMEESVCARVFEPFFTTRGDGNGLGLPMVLALTERQNGRIELETRPGEGTTFRLTFPASAAAPEQAVEEEGPAPVPVLAGAGTVLLVEDEKTLRRVARRVLERAGYTVLEAADGKVGLDILRDHRDELDLVVTDVVMPNLGGVALFDHAREDGIQVPFLFTSGYADRELRKEVDVISNKPFLRKPWDADQLLSTVASVMNSARMPNGG